MGNRKMMGRSGNGQRPRSGDLSKPSGMEKIPPILKKPFWTDRFFWIFLATCALWIAFFWWLFSG